MRNLFSVKQKATFESLFLYSFIRHTDASRYPVSLSGWIPPYRSMGQAKNVVARNDKMKVVKAHALRANIHELLRASI